MKVLGLVGSPRVNGCTSKMVHYLIDSAKAAGHDTEIIYLNKLNYRDCQGCYGCSNTFKCILNDDLDQVYDAVDDSDEIIIGSPIYMWESSGLVKNMVDRFLPYYMAHNKSEGFDKKVVFAYTQEDTDARSNETYIKSMEVIIERVGFTFKDTFVAGGNYGLDDIEDKTELIQTMKNYYL